MIGRLIKKIISKKPLRTGKKGYISNGLKGEKNELNEREGKRES